MRIRIRAPRQQEPADGDVARRRDADDETLPKVRRRLVAAADGMIDMRLPETKRRIRTPLKRSPPVGLANADTSVLMLCNRGPREAGLPDSERSDVALWFHRE